MILLDTSGLLAVIDTDETQHQEAANMFLRAKARVVHDHVLSELVALATARGFSRRLTFAFLRDLLDDSQTEVVWIDESMCVEALALLERRPDKTYSLCDAVSFVLMRRMGIHQALTTDRHFEQEGFLRLLR